MNPRIKWPLLVVTIALLLLATSCDPIPSCVPVYTVTKTDDTNDGVCSAGDCSLREAVNNANACPGMQTINLPAGGYTLTLDGDNEDLGQTGDLDVTDDLVIIGSGIPSIHGGIERAFHVHSGVTAAFEGVFLGDGDAIYGGGLVNEGDLTLSSFTCNYNNVSIPPGGMGDAMGGCIFNTGNLTILEGYFLANTAGFGGAIYNYDNATLTIEESSLIGNEAEFHGGAVWNGVNSTLEINSTTLSLNQAGWNGGGVWNHGTAHGTSLFVEDNQAVGNGGGFYNWEGFSTFTNSWFTLNTADLGGGFFNEEGMVHFYESGLTANTAIGGAGGGIYNNGPAPGTGLLLKNVTVSDNNAPGGLGGAGIYTTSNFDFRFITVAGNNPEGIRIDGGTEIKIRSSILADNPGGDCMGILPDSLDFNIVSDSSCALIGAHDLLDIDPFLEPLAANGGLAPSHALGVGSPAIDSGVPDLCIANDQVGTTRPQGPWCDRGAFENLYFKGIVRGWTYIDSNRNDNRDPGEGSVAGVIMELKEGPCPGGVIAATVLSNPDGYYRILEIEPGDYCLDTSPLQQTLDPEYIDLTFGAGDVLEDVNFRYLLSPLGNSSISGKVWHDECAVPYGTPPTPPPGCISLPGGGLGADGIYDPAEPGIEGVKITVFSGSCFYGGATLAGEVYTDIHGEFTVPELTAGIYCLNVHAGLAPNDTLLIPGNWTYPVRNAPQAMVDVDLAASEDAVDINFGWDHQFLPEPFVPFSFICPVDLNAFIRLGASTQHPELFTILKGELFEILAKSEPGGPPWYYGKKKDGEPGWISGAMFENCEELDPENLLVRESPPIPQLPTATPKPLVCTPELAENQCIRAGGEYKAVNDTLSLCFCPD